jgi:uncharacterized protein YndB with AHSA1/START domain
VLVAHAVATINASRARVWDALVDPETMKRYLPVTSVVSEWRENSAIVWKGELEGKPFEMRGTVVRVEPERLLEYRHALPIFRASGATPLEDHHVTIQLLGEERTRAFQSPSKATGPNASSRTPRAVGASRSPT